MEKRINNSISVFTWISLTGGIVCLFSTVIFVIVMFLPGGEYGTHQDLFNLFYPWFFLFGPFISVSMIPFGILGLINNIHRRVHAGRTLSVLGLCLTGMPLVVCSLLFVLFAVLASIIMLE